jgi:hypothetical protein
MEAAAILWNAVPRNAVLPIAVAAQVPQEQGEFQNPLP